MASLGPFFQQLVEMKVPSGPWSWVHVNANDTSSPLRLLMNFIMVPSETDPRVLTRDPVHVTLPRGMVNFYNVPQPQVQHWFNLVAAIPEMVNTIFELRRVLLEVTAALEAEARTTASKQRASLIRQELAFDGPEAPSRIIIP